MSESIQQCVPAPILLQNSPVYIYLILTFYSLFHGFLASSDLYLIMQSFVL